MKNKLLKGFIFFLFISGEINYPQSFMTSKLKDGEIYNFFQKMSVEKGNRYSIKIENAYDFFMEYYAKNRSKTKDVNTAIRERPKDYSKSKEKGKILYFALPENVECKYDYTEGCVKYGGSDEFISLKNYMKPLVKFPLVIEKVFKKKEEDKSAGGIDFEPVNEYIFFIDVLNSGKSFNRIFNKGVFLLKKEFSSDFQSANLLQNCRMLLGLSIPANGNILFREDKLGRDAGVESRRNLLHIGMCAQIRRVILFNKTENKIIYESFVE